MIAAMHGMSCWAGAHAFAGAACLLATAALAQNASPPPPADPPQVIVAPSPPAEAAPAPSARLPTPQETFSAIGRAIDQSIQSLGAGVNAGVRGTAETFGATTDAAGDLAKGVGDAAGTVARLPSTNSVSGRELCPTAPNGAPDCASASAGALPHERLSARQQPRHHVVLQVPAADVARGPRAEPAGMHGRVLRLARALPVALRTADL